LVLLITRRVPDAVAMRAAQEHVVRALALEGRFDPAMLLANVDGVDAILCTPADRFNAALIGQLPATVRVIGTFSVGLEHCGL
jgi:lactate dehydrogenase-like 2-hydroxyacid dehydrogenase